jgi:hypothetical protein
MANLSFENNQSIGACRLCGGALACASAFTFWLIGRRKFRFSNLPAQSQVLPRFVGCFYRAHYLHPYHFHRPNTIRAYHLGFPGRPFCCFTLVPVALPKSLSFVQRGPSRPSRALIAVLPSFYRGQCFPHICGYRLTRRFNADAAATSGWFLAYDW